MSRRIIVSSLVQFALVRVGVSAAGLEPFESDNELSGEEANM